MIFSNAHPSVDAVTNAIFESRLYRAFPGSIDPDDDENKRRQE